MRAVIYASRAKKDFEKLAQTDKKTFKKILQLIRDVQHHPFVGLGKPEPLKHDLAGYWSRRINARERLVYKISPQDEVVIISCKGHYLY